METPKSKSENSKRKHEELSSVSSVSDLDISKDSPGVSSQSKNTETENTEKQTKLTKKQRRKAAKLDSKNAELSLDISYSPETETMSSTKTETKSIETQLTEINSKLSDVFTKSDSGILKTLIKDTLLELKESLLAPLIKRVDIVEGELHDKVIENEKLKKQVDELNGKLESQKEECETLANKFKAEQTKSIERFNDQEQYSRKNSIRVSSVSDDVDQETAVATMEKVLTFFSTKLDVNLNQRDIDIAHRLGKFKVGTNRAVIIKFVNRYEKSRIMSVKKKLKGSGVSIFEDLTQLNNEVLASIRLKKKEEVDQSWSTNGKLFVKWKAGGNIDKVQFSQYQYWLQLPWPEA